MLSSPSPPPPPPRLSSKSKSHAHPARGTFSSLSIYRLTRG
jgi:hypothetical protein